MRHTYGVQRLHSELVANGVIVTAYKVKVLRQRLGIYCKQRKRYKCTTNSQHDKVVAPNRLGQNFMVSRPNQVWVSDITYVWTEAGWLDMAGIKDLFSCEMVGYAIGERMTAGLCLAALQMAQLRRQPKAGLILHSDRGSQYCAKAYQKRLAQAGILASMSRRGNCYDNAPMESFWGSLKNELIHQTQYKTREEARDAIVEYVEVFYNRIRRHSKLDNISPAEALRNFKLMQEELV
ncbi:integrase core domain protein [mine drainage metagenome]|uniref:Integrase core domain protein n=1 Tax=mine drainage metagenome TaxID=410659 RepID=A0A1J5RQG2_9ZZZZ